MRKIIRVTIGRPVSRATTWPSSVLATAGDVRRAVELGGCQER
jgi:hypothetical protein